MEASCCCGTDELQACFVDVSLDREVGNIKNAGPVGPAFAYVVCSTVTIPSGAGQ